MSRKTWSLKEKSVDLTLIGEATRNRYIYIIIYI